MKFLPIFRFRRKSRSAVKDEKSYRLIARARFINGILGKEAVMNLFEWIVDPFKSFSGLNEDEIFVLTTADLCIPVYHKPVPRLMINSEDI